MDPLAWPRAAPQASPCDHRPHSRHLQPQQARRQSDPVMGPENPGTGLARHEAPTQRFSALQQRLLCSALHFFHRCGAGGEARPWIS